MRLYRIFIFFFFCVLIGKDVSVTAQVMSNKKTASSRLLSIGREDDRFLWGVSGGITIPYGTPKTMFANDRLIIGYQFGMDFRHRLGYEFKSNYFVFLHYGVRMGSFFYKKNNTYIDNNAINTNDYSDESSFFTQNNPKFLHLDIPID